MSRTRWAFVIAGLVAVSVAWGAEPKTGKPAAKAPRKPNPAMLPIEDVAGLPRVLLIGDSISIGYTLAVREALSGKANVHRPTANCGPTSRGLTDLDRWLGEGRWDVIHFNFGLHDMKFIDDKRQVPLEQYDKNLREIVARLKKTGAKLIWCSTTPVPDGCQPGRLPEDAPAYNQAARKIMDENRIPIDDLYAFALPKLAEIQLPKNVHFTDAGSKVLAQQVSASIQAALPPKGK